jgi:hypothetical protein
VDLDYSLIRSWKYRWGSRRVRVSGYVRRRYWKRYEKAELLSIGIGIGILLATIFKLIWLK